jgi:hypothetical protein
MAIIEGVAAHGTEEVLMCCGTPVVGVRVAGIDHYEATQFYCRCNVCNKTGLIRSTLTEAIAAWRVQEAHREYRAAC